MTDAVQISVLSNAPTSQFSHYWETCVGSDRAGITKLEDWQSALAAGIPSTGFQYVRFHGILDDEMNFYVKSSSGVTAVSMTEIYTCYDLLLANNVKPFVEISFMPGALASDATATVNYYDANPSPPSSLTAWASVLTQFIEGLISKYGSAEVETWYFEIWNEPNEPTWTGTKAQYFDLYQSSANAIKAVNSNLRVGGPATAQVAWIPEFLAFCDSSNAPIDFVSAHVYPGDPQENIFGVDLDLPTQEVVPRALQVAKSRILAQSLPDLPLFITEWAAQNPAFIADTVNRCYGICDFMCYWELTTIFEESGPIGKFDSEYFGLLDQNNVPRTSFHVYQWLFMLGTVRVFTGDNPCIVTRQEDGSLAILVWNLPSNSDVAKMGTVGPDITFNFYLDGKSGDASVTIIDPLTYEVDVLYNEWGRPDTLTSSQISELQTAGLMPSATSSSIDNHNLSITLTSNSVAFISIP